MAAERADDPSSIYNSRPVVLAYSRPTAESLSSHTYDQVQDAMLLAGPYSFAEQMSAAYRRKPSAVLVTALSAIPVADSVRGFYAESGAPTPIVDYIRPIRQSGVMGRLLRQEEHLRLIRLLDAAGQRVYVIDEYRDSGQTLLDCLATLDAIGIDGARGIAGKWYHDVARGDLDINRCTSKHAPFMRQVGVLACQQSEL